MPVSLNPSLLDMRRLLPLAASIFATNPVGPTTSSNPSRKARIASDPTPLAWQSLSKLIPSSKGSKQGQVHHRLQLQFVDNLLHHKSPSQLLGNETRPGILVALDPAAFLVESQPGCFLGIEGLLYKP